MKETSTVTIGIREIEEGFTVFVFESPPALDQSRLHCLLDALGDWRRHHTGRRVEDLQVIRENGLVRGLHIFWSLFATKNASNDFNFRVRNDVVEKYGQEYLEALMEDSAKFMANVRHPHPVCVLLSRRDIAIVAYKDRNETAILSYEQFLGTLPTELAELIAKTFRDFKRSDAQGYHVAPLPDNYVVPEE